MKELRDIIALWEEHGGSCALATLVRTRGSSYRRPGARMLITSRGEMAGALSAGCIEEEIASHAQAVIATGEPLLVSFDTRRRFGCNGSIEIFIEPLQDEFILQLREKMAARESFDIVTIFDGGGGFGSIVQGFVASDDWRAANETAGTLVQTVEPGIRLLIFGDGVDADALSGQAQLLGWDAHVLPSITELRTGIDDRTAAVIMTHNFGRDCAALRHLCPLGLLYVGLVGPRRRREELLIDVLDSGASLRSELFAPAGLHLGGDMPEEVALSIIAEVQRVFTAGTGEHLRDRKAPIHQDDQVTWPELPA